MKEIVARQDWVECEKGWGTRPDGYSLHDNLKDHKAYIDEYWASMPADMPAAFSSPDGGPYPTAVDERTYQKILESKNGIRRQS
jgi:hypothetical protein